MADPIPTETLSLNYEKVEWTYSEKDAAADSFDFAAAPEDGESAMLLPAVQTVREAARRSDADDGVKMGDGAVIFTTDIVEPGETAYEYKLDGVMISSYDVNGSGDEGHDQWIDILSTDWGAHKPTAEAGLRSDGELVQAVSDADMGGDFIL